MKTTTYLSDCDRQHPLSGSGSTSAAATARARSAFQGTTGSIVLETVGVWSFRPMNPGTAKRPNTHQRPLSPSGRSSP